MAFLGTDETSDRRLVGCRCERMEEVEVEVDTDDETSKSKDELCGPSMIE